jgi:hypothetical protein
VSASLRTRATTLVVLFAVLAVAGLVGLSASPNHQSPGRTTTAASGGSAANDGTSKTSSSTTIRPPQNAAVTARATNAIRAAITSNKNVKVPGTFKANLVNLYRTITQAAAIMPGGTTLVKSESTHAFSESLNKLTAHQLGYVFAATSTAKGFAAATSAVSAFIPVERATVKMLAEQPKVKAAVPSSTSSNATHTANPHTTGPSVPQNLTVVPDVMPQTGSFGGGVMGTAYIANCPSYWSTSIDPYSDDSIYALQLVIDIAGAVYNAASSFDDAFPVSAIADALTLVAQEVQNDGLYLKGDFEGCQANNTQEAGLDIDNSTYQTYELLASVAGTANEADTNLAALINQNAADYEFQLQEVIEQALTQPASSAPMASLELPATAGGYLDSTPVGVAEVVTTELANLDGAGQVSNPTAQRDFGLAGQAYSAGQYKSAFRYYRLAYQAASE